MQKKKILIIDDEATFAQIVKLNLEESGEYEVKTENKGANGFAMAKEFRPELILLDIMMPDVDGFKILKTLKNDDDTINIPVIMLTAVGSDSAKLKAVQMYCEDYILKPVTTEGMKEKIEKVLKRRNIS